LEDRHRYPERAIYADYLRAAGGLALTAGPLLALDLAAAVGAVFGALALLFGWFAWRTWVRHRSSIAVSAEGVERAGPRPCRIAWRDLERVRLAYYAPRRAQDQGWFQLTLRGRRGGVLRVDSSLEGFDHLLAQVLEHARDRRLAFDDTTACNLEALGLSTVVSGAEHPGWPD